MDEMEKSSLPEDVRVFSSERKLDKKFGVKVALVLSGLIFFAGLLFYPLLSGSAQSFLDNGLNAAGTHQFLPLLYQSNPTDTPTSTATSTATATATPTATVTNTPIASATATATATKTGTLPTTTLTGTPTVTGTISPGATLVVKVTPTAAEIGQKFTFTIDVSNGGTGPATNVVLADSFPSYIDVESVVSQRGTVTRSTHSFTVSIGSVYPGERITVTAVVKVNSNAAQTETISNVVTMTYDPGLSKNASVSYKVIVDALPGTGDPPMASLENAEVNRVNLIQSLLAGLLGVILLGYAIWASRRSGSEARSARWLSVAGSVLIVLSLFSGLVAAGVIGGTKNETASVFPVEVQPSGTAVPVAGVLPEAAAPTHQPAADFATPAPQPQVTLPVYPIPSPEVSITPGPGEAEPDTTAVKRIVIPYLLLDTVVAYIPYDGQTWLISGLTQEVAWLGDTSWPGLGSNTGLAAHVTVAGQGDGPFRRLEELPVGELVILYTEKNMYTYQVREQTMVDADAMWVTYATANPQITLITCANWNDDVNAYLDRLVVYADLVRSEPIMRSGNE
jgi:LPXTG-site transpeptidase (sortase) family protein